MNLKLNLILLSILNLVINFSNAQGWLGKDLTNMSNLNVKELTDLQRREVLTAAKAQGLNVSDLEYLLKAKGLDAPSVMEVENQNTIQTSKKDSILPIKKIQENILQSSIAVFGQQLFENTKAPLWNNALVAPTKEYLLGVGDNITVRIYGLQEQKSNLVINREGNVFLPNGGKFKLKGLTIEAAESVIRRGLIKSGYASLASGRSSVNISVEDFHSIQVVVWGAQRSGSYTVPAMSTIFDVLFQSGGPDLNRSYRSIKLIRNGKEIKELDLYDFLTEGKTNNNIVIQTGDIIFIPYYDKRLRLRGEVKTPAIYELKPNETLDDILEFAGGFSEIAYRKSIQIIRYGQEGKEFYSMSLKDLDTFQVRGGEIIDIQSINNIEKFRIELVGAVKRPGFYAGSDSNTLQDLIHQAGGADYGAVRSNVLIRKNFKNGLFRYEQYNFNDISNKKISVLLKDVDKVYLMDSGDLNYRENVQIMGNVRNPGSYKYGENLSLGDLLFMAGGFSPDAIKSQVILSRKVIDEDIYSEIMNIETSGEFWNKSALFNVMLQPGDVVTTYKNPLIREQVYIAMEGELKKPGVYPMESKSQTLWDVYQLAGGINNYGVLEEAILIRHKQTAREKIQEMKKSVLLNEIYKNDTIQTLRDSVNLRQFDTIALANLNSVFSINKILKSIVIEPGDRLIVPKRINTIRIEGEVYRPNALFYDLNSKFKDYITMGGGLRSNADLDNTYVVYSNGTAKKSTTFLGLFRRYPKIKPGCTIYIPFKMRVNEKEKLSLTERLAIYSILSTSISSFALIFSQLR
jgi:protein involved in polysaccharide export with SLBB domain